MPQAVDKYIKTNNLSAVDTVKRDIIALYEEDLRKIDTSFTFAPGNKFKRIG
jgi:hypothetical protein